jgi:hypothetical protein
MRGLVLACLPLVAVLLGSSSHDRREFSNTILAGFYPDPSICRVAGGFVW